MCIILLLYTASSTRNSEQQQNVSAKENWHIVNVHCDINAAYRRHTNSLLNWIDITENVDILIQKLIFRKLNKCNVKSRDKKYQIYRLVSFHHLNCSSFHSFGIIVFVYDRYVFCQWRWKGSGSYEIGRIDWKGFRILIGPCQIVEENAMNRAKLFTSLFDLFICLVKILSQRITFFFSNIDHRPVVYRGRSHFFPPSSFN